MDIHKITIDLAFGFFSDFLTALAGIGHCVAVGAEPYVVWTNPIYQSGPANLFDRYFYQADHAAGPFAHTYVDRDFRGGFVQHFDQDDATIYTRMRPVAGLLRERRIFAASPHLARLPAGHFGGQRVLGFHKRGTDHDQRHIPDEVWVKWVREEMKRTNCNRVFVISDSQLAVDYFRRELGPSLLTTSAFRSASHIPVHIGQNGPRGSRGFQLAEEVLLDAYLLSQCTRLLLCQSNVSQVAMLMAMARDEQWGLDRFRYMHREAF